MKAILKPSKCNMNSGKIHVLGIVPYEGMKSVMQKQADERDDIDLTVYVGDLHKGVEIVQKNFHKDYDVIISRGGTAELIGSVTQLPVIEIEMSIYDILRSIKMAESFAPDYAIVGFPSITKSARLLCDLMQYHVKICTIHSADEVREVLLSLQRQNIHMIICDMITNTTAKQLGLGAILINSGVESINQALNQAVKLCRSHSLLRTENRFLKQVIEKNGQETIIYNHKQELFFSTLEPSEKNPVIEALQKEIDETLSQNTQRFFKNINGTLYSVTNQLIPYNDQIYVVYYLSANKIPPVSSKYGVQYLSKGKLDDTFYNHFYNPAKGTGNLQETVGQLCQTSLPVMIIGENGTGKNYVAEAIYARGLQQQAPLVSIDFSMINDKSWNFLTNHYNSPLNDNNNTIYFKNIDHLPEPRIHHLLSVIIDMNLSRRNRLLFSCTCNPEGSISGYCTNYINRLSCLTLHLPTLRERKDEIPALANLLLSALNVSMAKEILGLDSSALNLLQEYRWPYNYTQFKRLLTDLAAVTTESYISRDAVHHALKREEDHLAASFGPNTCHLKENSPIDLNQTLENINRNIIRTVLNETGGNQSAAAKRLGIGRTTLWRYLKNQE